MYREAVHRPVCRRTGLRPGKGMVYNMDKEEFIMKLQHALAGGISGSQTAEHVRYYREYIDSEIHKGRTEEEILEQLGDPRLLARSIVDANRRSGAAYSAAQEYDDEVGANAREGRLACYADHCCDHNAGHWRGKFPVVSFRTCDHGCSDRAADR